MVGVGVGGGRRGREGGRVGTKKVALTPSGSLSQGLNLPTMVRGYQRDGIRRIASWISLIIIISTLILTHILRKNDEAGGRGKGMWFGHCVWTQREARSALASARRVWSFGVERTTEFALTSHSLASSLRPRARRHFAIWRWFLT